MKYRVPARREYGLSASDQTAAKEYRCGACKRPILKGTWYHKIRFTRFSSPTENYYYHQECKNVKGRLG